MRAHRLPQENLRYPLTTYYRQPTSYDIHPLCQYQREQTKQPSPILRKGNGFGFNSFVLES